MAWKSVVARFGLLIALAAPLFTGCVLSQSTTGVSLADVAFDEIAIGRSTRADVTRLLGPPDEIVYSNRQLDPLFERVFLYERPRTRTTGTFLVIFAAHRNDTQIDRAAIFFNERGIVEDVSWRLDGESAEYGMPW